MMDGLETVALKKRQQAKLELTELKMLRFLLKFSRMDEIEKSVQQRDHSG